MPIIYQEGKIYKIYNTINDDIYVGSTTQKLCERMRDHRYCTTTAKLHTKILRFGSLSQEDLIYCAWIF